MKTRHLDPERHRVVSPGLMTALVVIIQVVVLAVLALFVFDAFETEAVS